MLYLFFPDMLLETLNRLILIFCSQHLCQFLYSQKPSIFKNFRILFYDLFLFPSPEARLMTRVVLPMPVYIILMIVVLFRKMVYSETHFSGPKLCIFGENKIDNLGD